MAGAYLYTSASTRHEFASPITGREMWAGDNMAAASRNIDQTHLRVGGSIREIERKRDGERKRERERERKRER